MKESYVCMWTDIITQFNLIQKKLQLLGANQMPFGELSVFSLRNTMTSVSTNNVAFVVRVCHFSRGA